MPSWLEALRMNSNFNPAYQQVSGGQNMPDYGVSMEATDMPDQSGPVMKDGGFDYGTPPIGMNYQPEHAATDRYNELIKQYPQDERPGALQSIAAALAQFGPGGQQAAHHVMEGENERRMLDWKNQVSTAQQAANLERQNNTNERTASQQLSLLQRQLDVDNERERHNREIEKHQIEQDKIATDKLHGKKELTTKGGQRFLYDPQTGELAPTGVQTGTMTEQSKLDDQQSAAAELVRLRGQEALELQKEKDAEKQKATKYTEAAKQAIKDRANESISVIDTLLGKDDKLTELAQSAVGKSRLFPMHYIPGTQAKQGDVAINNLKSQLVINLIGEMKAQSRTGATGFGALNLKELQVLENAANQLDPALDEDAFAAELKRIREKLSKILQPESGTEPTKAKNDTTVVQPGSVIKLSPGELLKKYGG